MGMAGVSETDGHKGEHVEKHVHYEDLPESASDEDLKPFEVCTPFPFGPACLPMLILSLATTGHVRVQQPSSPQELARLSDCHHATDAKHT